MGELVAFFVGLVTDNLGHAGQRWVWWILGAIVVLVMVSLTPFRSGAMAVVYQPA